jgi:RNA polymerase sigma-70 factor (ECF subfamily)
MNKLDFKEIYSEFKISVERISFYFEKNKEKQNELNQDIWIRVWKSLENFNNECSLKTWIYRVAHNTAINHVIKDKKNKSLMPLEDVFVSTENLEQNLENKQSIDLLNEIIFTLKPLDKELVILYLEGNTQEEIEVITGLSKSNISTKISRLKNILKKIMQKKESSNE